MIFLWGLYEQRDCSIKSDELQCCALGCLAVPKAMQWSRGPELTVSKDTSDSFPAPAAGMWLAGGSCLLSALSSAPAHRGEGSHSRTTWSPPPVTSRSCFLLNANAFSLLWALNTIWCPLALLVGVPMTSHPLLPLKSSPCPFLSLTCGSM